MNESIDYKSTYKTEAEIRTEKLWLRILNRLPEGFDFSFKRAGILLLLLLSILIINVMI